MRSSYHDPLEELKRLLAALQEGAEPLWLAQLRQPERKMEWIPAIANPLLNHMFAEAERWADLHKAEVAETDQVTDSTESTEDGTGKVGRPRLTERELQARAQIVDEVLRTQKKLNITLEQACARKGIPYSTFRDWRRKTTKK